MKVKTYIEIVTRCVECPAYDSDCTCALTGTFVTDSWVIPEWCPLEDV